jgi:hypothetical protein
VLLRVFTAPPFIVFNPLKTKEIERRRENRGGIAIGTLFNVVEHKFTATKFPRQCPLVLLVKIVLVKVRRLEVEEREREKRKWGVVAIGTTFNKGE